MSKNYKVLAGDIHGSVEVVATSHDEVQTPRDYNEWSELAG